MRDRGFDFHHEYPYCENLFAVGFEAGRDANQSYELVTAFEFMEHASDPMGAARSILERTGSFLISTEIIPHSGLEQWHYLASESGQHISLYTVKALQEIASQYSLNLYTNTRSLHLITDKKLPDGALNLRRTLLERLKRRKLPSLLRADYNKARGGQNSY